MSIKANVSLGTIAIAATDTTLVNPADPVDRVSVNALSIHNDGSAGSTLTVEIFESPDLTSASGERVGYYSIADGKSIDVLEVIGQGYAQGENVIAKASGTGLIARPTVTNYDGGS